jgi:serine protease Do
MGLPKKSGSKVIAASTLAIVSLFGAVTAANAQTVQRIEPRIFSFETVTSGYLGVQTENINKENLGKYNLNEVRGVGITNVVENSPAAQAGLRERDVILKFDGAEVKSVSKLMRLLSEVAPDHKVRLTIYRSGGEQEIVATLGKREMSDFGGFSGEMPNFEGVPSPRITPLPFPRTPRGMEGLELPRVPEGDTLLYFSNGRKIGVTAMPLNKQLGGFFGSADGKGLLVEEVRENSPAAKAGLKAGDVILEVDGQAVEQQGDLVRLLNKKAEGDVNLTILRDKQRQTIRVSPEGKAPQTAPANPGTKFRI